MDDRRRRTCVAQICQEFRRSVPDRSVRGYIRIARQFVLPEEQRVKMCQTAFDAAHQTAEKKLVLDVLKRYPCVDTLKQAISETRCR